MFGPPFPPIPGGLTGMKFPYGVQYPDQLPALEHGLTSGAGITSLYAAVANRNAARVDIPVIGDSITEGQGATAFTSRWIAQANRATRAAYPTTANGASGGQGFIPMMTTGETSYTWPVALASGGASLEPFDLGPVRASAHVFGAASWTWTAPTGTTSVRVMYFDAGVPGSFTYRVGSGSTTTVTSAGTAAEAVTASITITGGQVLTIAWASGDAFIDGIVHYAGDENSGVTFHGCGHFGWATTDWNTAEVDDLNWAQCYAAFPGPAALAIMLGTNDAVSLTAADFAAGLATLTATVRGSADALAGLPLILVIPYQPDEAVADPGGWAAYAAAARSAAAADPVGAIVIDLNYRLPPVASGFDGGALYADTVHPTNLGHALIGEIAAAGPRIA